MATYIATTAFIPTFLDDNGNLLNGGTLESYIAGTTTPTPTFTGEAGVSAGDIITLNARGEPETSGNTHQVWIDSAIKYDFVLKTAAGVIINSPEDIASPLVGSVASTLNIASAKALTTLTDGQAIYIRGYTTAADGGGGMYVYDASSAATANDGTVLALDTLPGRLLHGETTAITVKTFGAVGDGVAVDTAAIQATADAVGDVLFTAGSFVCGAVNINTRGAQVLGQGKHLTEIIPVSDSVDRSIFIIGNERITVRGFWFRPVNYTKGVQDATNTSRPIWIENIGNSDAAVTWVDISNNVFENISGSAIVIKSPLRESWIYRNNFIGMGNPITGEGVIDGSISENFIDSVNNLWIYKNTFYRAATPFINLDAVNGSAPSKHFYDSLWIEKNLFHGQLLDVTENDGSSGAVQAEPTNQIYIRSCSRVRLRDNTFTSYHGDYSAIIIAALSTFEENGSVLITDNALSVDDNGSYTGTGILLIDCTLNLATNNSIKTGSQALDIRVQDTGTFSLNQRIKIENNVPTEGTPVGVLLPSSYNLNLQTEERKQLTSLEVTETVTAADASISRSGTITMAVGVAQVTIDYTDLGLLDLSSASYAINLSSNFEHPIYWRSKSTTGFTLNRDDTADSQQVDWTVII